MDDLIALWFEPAWVMYLFLMGGAIVGLGAIYKIYEHKKDTGSPLPHSNVIMPVIYAVWSALFGTMSVSQAKVLGELLAINGDGPCETQVFSHWFTYISILLWLLTVSVWLYRLNSALSKFNPLFIIPLLQCMFIFFAIVSGGIFFKEFKTFSASQWLGFCSGVTVMFAGLVFLVPNDTEDDYDDEDSSHHPPVDFSAATLKNPVPDLPPPSPPPMAQGRGKSVDLVSKTHGGKRRKSMTATIAYGLADAIAGGPITVDPKSPPTAVGTVPDNPKWGPWSKKEGGATPKRGMGRRRMSLAGALTVEMLEKGKRKKEKEEKKRRRASKMNVLEGAAEIGGEAQPERVGNNKPILSNRLSPLSFVLRSLQAPMG